LEEDFLPSNVKVSGFEEVHVKVSLLHQKAILGKTWQGRDRRDIQGRGK
jgi:hypothetical protein